MKGAVRNGFGSFDTVPKGLGDCRVVIQSLGSTYASEVENYLISAMKNSTVAEKFSDTTLVYEKYGE